MKSEQAHYEHEPRKVATIREAVSGQEVVPARMMQVKSWLATYPNEAFGVSTQWVTDNTDAWLRPERLARSIEMLESIINDPNQFYRIAEVDGEVAGFIHAAMNGDGVKEIQALYTDPKTFGTGVGAQLMEATIEWIGDADATLEVVTYNQRARRFYEKHGFIPIAGSDHMYADTMPVITMMRKGERHEI